MIIWPTYQECCEAHYRFEASSFQLVLLGCGPEDKIMHSEREFNELLNRFKEANK